MINRVLRLLSAFLRRQLIGVWMAGLSIPERIGVLKEDGTLFLKNSAYYSLQAFFNEKPSGATVFWTPERAGKTYTLAQMGMKSTTDRRFVYIDFAQLATGDDAKKVFYRQMGLDPDDDTKSLRSSSFNLLIMVNNRLSAHALLASCGQQLQREYVRLLGPPYCGRWSSAELGRFSDERYDSLVDQCGTLAPMISIRNRTCPPSDPLMLLRVAKLEAEWAQGEQLLGQYRSCWADV